MCVVMRIRSDVNPTSLPGENRARNERDRCQNHRQMNTTFTGMELAMKLPLMLLGLLAACGTANWAAGAGVEIVSTFDGDKGPGFKAAANVMGGVGPKHVVDFTISGFTVHEKTTGKVLRHSTQQEFWRQVEPADTLLPQGHANDPWMVYDPL